ncbi:MAG: sugar phosphate isomerase/epimerase [Acidobacteria bacterium]|nr:sugar phosphate isomerase/epimerase [Acidobacteriota bacterium]
MFWAGRDSLAELKGMGVRCGQLGIAGGVALTDAFAAEWKAALAEHEFALITVFAAYDGEDYADIPTVERTVGFIPRATRAVRVARTLEISDFAAKIGAPGIACHIGFVPHDTANPDYLSVREAVRQVCDHAARYGQTFALETGQEPAATLLQFFKDVARPNLRINFDPANMILYGTGDPIEALKLLAPHVVSVHAKDGDWPPKDQPGALGTERPLGQGSVGIPKFVATLKEIGYSSSLNIERETEPQDVRIADIRMAVGLLSGLK